MRITAGRDPHVRARAGLAAAGAGADLDAVHVDHLPQTGPRAGATGLIAPTGPPARASATSATRTPASLPRLPRAACLRLTLGRRAPARMRHQPTRVRSRAGLPRDLHRPAVWDGVMQVNVALPATAPHRHGAVELDWIGKPLCAPAVGPHHPPRAAGAASLPVIRRRQSALRHAHLSGTVKVTMEEVLSPRLFLAAVDRRPVFGAGSSAPIRPAAASNSTSGCRRISRPGRTMWKSGWAGANSRR